ncbi:MAG: PQQ-binding-like beta-propeller repeat protein [bacterium]|nr:PQQ-binding-like beta-propeller repeat protein [bacterium]
MADISKGPLNAVKKIDPTNPRFNDILTAGPEQPATKKPLSAVGKVPAGSTVPGPPQQYFCDIQDYTSGGAAYFWAIPDAYGDDLFNMRFTSDAAFDCSLKVAHYLMYWPNSFDSDMRCYLWADDGFGFPGAKLDSVDIPWATIDAAHTAAASNLFFVSADFSASDWVFSDGAEYHLGFTALNQTTGSLAIISDAADGPYVGEERASENWSGLWGSMLNDWGLDVSFFIYAERCCTEIPFTDCYTDAPISNVAYFWRAPHPTYGDEEYSMKFAVDAQDTLVSVDVAIYDDGGSASSTDPAGNNTVYMTVYGDDGAGLPNSADVITQVVLPPASYAFYPTLTTVPFDYVLPGAGTYHVAFGSDGVFGSGTYESTLSSDGTDGVGASASNWGGGYWVDFLSGWGLDVNFYYLINICNDEYTLCSANSCNNGLAYFWNLPDAYGDVGHGQKISSEGVECRVQEVTWALYDAGEVNGYTTASRVAVWSDLGGLPGIELASIDIGPGTLIPYVLYPGMTTVDFEPLDVYVTSDYWITISSYGATQDEGIATLSDAGGGTCTDTWVEDWGANNWHLITDGWGVGADWAVVAESYHCCSPFGEFTCNPGGDDDWSTLQGNFQRTGRSNLPVGDSWCDLNLAWHYEDATDGVSFCGPTVFEDKVLCAFNTHVQVFDLAGTLQYTIAPGGVYMGTGVRATPTVVSSANLGIDMILLGGGDQQSILAYDLATGAMVWGRSVIEVGPGGLFGATRWGTFVVLDQGGTEVAYWGTDLGNIVAAELATGALYAGWATNPIAAGFSTYKTGATDGSQVFFGTYSPAGEGDIYAIDGATGAINWQLSSSGGLQAVNVFGAAYTAGEEGFEGLSYDNGTVFANSRCEGDYPVDGLMYYINAADGSLPLGTATTSNRARESSPIVDINRIYMPTLTRWVGPPAGGPLPAFNRATGAVDFATGSATGGRYYVDGLLTCEPLGEPDQLFAFNEDGFLSCFNGDDGTEIWRRRIFNASGYAPNIGMAGAIADDPVSGDVHVLFGDFWGNLFDLQKGADRARLQFVTYSPSGPVEFGAAASLNVDLGPLFTNTGCIDLEITSMVVDEISPTGQDLPGFSIEQVDGNLMHKASTLAGDLTNDVANKLNRIPVTNTLAVDDQISVRSMDKELSNPAASGFPTFINGVNVPYVGQLVAPGEVVNLNVDVIQANILRGPQAFYIALGTNDPDFFLNDVALIPEVLVTLVGGCLIDTTEMTFGVGGANFQLVTNSSRLGTGDWSPHGFSIDGDDASYYQGSFIHHVSQYRMAVHTQDWASGGGEAEALYSMQPDPNYCDNDCKPALTSGVALGEMWDGASYVPITGNMVCATYLDSVQNTWDYGWDGFGQPFDNDSTMGLMTNQRTIGALDVPELANFTLAIMEITERNGNPVDGWYLSAIHDYDVGSDLAGHNNDYSIGWSYNPGGDGAWGQIKIPFGPCDGPGAINTHGLTGPMALFDWGATSGYWDSAYIWATSAPGYYDHDMAQSGGDGEVHHTLASHNFAGGDTYEVGVATFGVAGLTDNTTAGAELAPMAILINQWAGFGRGDVNNDGSLGNLADIIYLAQFVNGSGTGPIPFIHLGDVNCDAAVDGFDVDALIDYYFYCGACPCGEFVF